MKRFTVDRIEGGFAVLECENGEYVNAELKSLPKNIAEGDVLSFDNGSCFLDENEKRARSEKIKSLMDKLFE